MYQKILSPKWLLTLAIILLSLASVPFVRAHGGDITLIHACVKNATGEIKIIAANATCPSNYRALDWNIQGPAGPAGPEGPVGPPGPQGPAGISGLQVVTEDSGIRSTERIDLFLTCPNGKQILGGGYRVDGNNLGISVLGNGPNGPSQWAVSAASSNGSVVSGWSLKGFAICANVAP